MRLPRPSPGPFAVIAALLAPLTFAASAQTAAPAKTEVPPTEAASSQIAKPAPRKSRSIRYSIDAGASSVEAKVSFFALASKTARFPEMAGDVTLVSDRPEDARIDVTFDAAAIEAPDETTLNRLRGEKFFWVEKYPQVRFVGEKLTLTSPTKGKVKGKLTARGVTRPATLAIEFDTPPLTAAIGKPIGFIGETTIDRREFGMKSYQLIVGNKVEITLSARMRPA
jgi:polyisoprenoid-binding protein YceI